MGCRTVANKEFDDPQVAKWSKVREEKREHIRAQDREPSPSLDELIGDRERLGLCCDWAPNQVAPSRSSSDILLEVISPINLANGAWVIQYASITPDRSYLVAKLGSTTGGSREKSMQSHRIAASDATSHQSSHST
ncbi:hypothetical protein BU26DRAFT_563393 [Trematosphaeria pertusa]|uniref:Uncharacterized protein n=1 Tax=Trematosphaeria pertusa TaxID=390896 RepID=A0A6A6IMK0_9PLEO|nr:uncharacterized protein BU26DRAFT_563393 [Trematosphaeria pertusa]KAF2251457.1 hypothetical protein BU26DRAFT_563393 [Trematosphaeria pertusa]